MADSPFARTRRQALTLVVSPFYKNFLRDGRHWFRSNTPSIHLAAFGKHPGWNDHMDDIGLATDSLVTLKRLLYLKGIAANIASGAWENLAESERLPGFDHTFRWQRDDQYLLGRMWSSRDGKGRAHFPMVLCVHVIGSPAPPAAEVRERLETTRQQCLETQSPETVCRSILETLEDLRSLSPCEESDSISATLEPGDLSTLADFLPGKFHPRRDPPSALLRLESVTRDLDCWALALHRHLDRDAPFLVTMPLHDGANWLDLIVGEPTPDDFLPLRTVVS